MDRATDTVKAGRLNLDETGQVDLSRISLDEKKAPK